MFAMIVPDETLHFYRLCGTSMYSKVLGFHAPRETREGWPLLTVDAKVNGDSRSTNERGPSILGWFIRFVVPVQDIFALPWLL